MFTDKPSEDRISKLHPKVVDEVRSIISHINNTLLTGKAKVRISQGIRTWAEQNELYAQGRTKPGKIVTNAKAGQSIHNYGLAVDIVLIVDNDGNGTYETASWDTAKDFDQDKKADWMEVVEYFKSKGWTWGGDWKSFKDMPHFEKTFGKSLKELQSTYNNKQWITGTNFVKI